MSRLKLTEADILGMLREMAPDAPVKLVLTDRQATCEAGALRVTLHDLAFARGTTVRYGGIDCHLRRLAFSEKSAMVEFTVG